MYAKLVSVTFALGLVAGSATADPERKLATLGQANLLSGKILKIAQEQHALAKKNSAYDEAQATKKVEGALKAEKRIDVLTRVALISYLQIYPGSAEDQAVDSVFESARNACIRRIEAIGGQPAIDALEDIQRRMQPDGAYSLTLTAALERLKAPKK